MPVNGKVLPRLANSPVGLFWLGLPGEVVGTAKLSFGAVSEEFGLPGSDGLIGSPGVVGFGG